MNFYQVDAASGSPGQVLISGEHRWILPGLICPTCGTWGATGNEFPCAEPSREQVKYFKDGPQTLDWFKDVLPKSGLKLPDGSPAKPTAEFGQLEGRIESGRTVTDFIWPRSWTILARQNVKELLAGSGCRVSGFAEAQIKGSAKLNEKFHELQIEGGLLLDESCMERSGPDCKLCGRSPVRLGSRSLKLRGSQSPPKADLFRAANFPTLIFANEGFVSFAKKQSFSNIIFQPVEVTR